MSPRGPLPALAGPVDVPAAVHAHVRVQDQIAGERHQQMLAARDDRFDGAPDDGVVVGDAVEGGKDRLEPRDGVPAERALQRARGAEDRVAFRHRRRLAIYDLRSGDSIIHRHRRLPNRRSSISCAERRLKSHRAGDEAGFDEVRRQRMRRRAGRRRSLRSACRAASRRRCARARSARARRRGRPAIAAARRPGET